MATYRGSGRRRSTRGLASKGDRLAAGVETQVPLVSPGQLAIDDGPGHPAELEDERDEGPRNVAAHRLHLEIGGLIERGEDIGRDVLRPAREEFGLPERIVQRLELVGIADVGPHEVASRAQDAADLPQKSHPIDP